MDSTSISDSTVSCVLAGESLGLRRLIWGVKSRVCVPLPFLIVLALLIDPISLPEVPNFLFLVTTVNALLNYVEPVNHILRAGVSLNIRIRNSFPGTGYSLSIILRTVFTLCISHSLAVYTVNHDTCYPLLQDAQLLHSVCDLSAYSSVV